MFCVIASEAANGFSASGVDAADDVPAFCATSLLFAIVGDDDAEVVEAVAAGGESSAPQPLNAYVASAINSALARRLSLLMSASGFLKADAVSNPSEKYL